MDSKQWKKLLHENTLNEVDYSNPGEILVAKNHSFWQWEYDARDVYAYLYLNEKTDKLRLVIEKVTRKTGIGKGEWHEHQSFDVGTGQKPKLSQIRGLLKKHGLERSRTGRPFKKTWQDTQGSERSLGDILGKVKTLK